MKTFLAIAAVVYGVYAGLVMASATPDVAFWLALGAGIVAVAIADFATNGLG